MQPSLLSLASLLDPSPHSPPPAMGKRVADSPQASNADTDRAEPGSALVHAVAALAISSTHAFERLDNGSVVDENVCESERAYSVAEAGAEASKTKKNNHDKNKKKALAVKRLGGNEDIAFASASNFDHTVDPPFKLNAESVVNSIGSYQGAMALEDPSDISPEAYANSIGLPTAMHVPSAEQLSSASHPVNIYGPGGPDAIAMIGFGGSDGDPWSYIICDAWSRLALKGHSMLNQTLFIEPHVSRIPLRIREVPGRGKALFATRDIAPGEIFLREPPLLVMKRNMDMYGVYNFEKLIEPMHERCKAAFDALANCKPFTGPRVSARHNIARTNGFSVDFTPLLGPDRGEFSGIMQIMSRANHSCAPNTLFNWDWKRYQALFTARRPIAMGEEVTVSYIDTRPPTATRREELKKKYYFTCTCERCGPV